MTQPIPARRAWGREAFSVCATATVRIPLLPEFVDTDPATGQFRVETDRCVHA